MPSEPVITDRGDGVKGHYCICRQVYADESRYGARYIEVWDGTKWTSAGTVYMSRQEAEEEIHRIRQRGEEGK